MAKVASRSKTPPHIARLTSALKKELASAGISARVNHQRIAGTRLHRVVVLAKEFERLRPTERQDLVWRIADHALQRQDLYRISTIYTLTPDESRGIWT